MGTASWTRSSWSTRSGAEETGKKDHIGRTMGIHRGALNADGTKIFAYLTIPENCKIGVCAHELGHLLFAGPTCTTPTDRAKAWATGA